LREGEIADFECSQCSLRDTKSGSHPDAETPAFSEPGQNVFATTVTQVRAVLFTQLVTPPRMRLVATKQFTQESWQTRPFGDQC